MVIDDVAEFLEKKRWTIDWPSKRKKVDHRLTHQHIYIYIYIDLTPRESYPGRDALPCAVLYASVAYCYLAQDPLGSWLGEWVRKR